MLVEHREKGLLVERQMQLLCMAVTQFRQDNKCFKIRISRRVLGKHRKIMLQSAR